MLKSNLNVIGVVVAAVAVMFTGCVDNSVDPNAPHDPNNNGGGGKGNDINNYGTVIIGNQTWMAENLDYNVEGSKCYNNDTTNCEKYGRLYTWDAAMSACPADWHLPSDAEWTTLTDFIGGSLMAGTKLKSSEGWNVYSDVPTGIDEYDFSALPGGYGDGDSFFNAGKFGSWWSATEHDTGSAWNRYINYDNESVVSINYVAKTRLCSVRCVQDF